MRARRSEPQKISITRDVVTIPPVAERVMPDGIGYIKSDTLVKKLIDYIPRQQYDELDKTAAKLLRDQPAA